MITHLNGTLVERLPGRVVIEAQGLGYEALIPMSTYEKLPEEGKNVKILTHFHVREQEQTLYGFLSPEERDLFRLLIGRVSGIGPKNALSILSGLSVPAFQQAVVDQDTASLAQIKGLGKKTAERIIIELKDKVGVAESWSPRAEENGSSAAQAHKDTVMALVALGYKQADAQKAALQASKTTDNQNADSQALLRLSLRLLSA